VRATVAEAPSSLPVYSIAAFAFATTFVLLLIDELDVQRLEPPHTPHVKRNDDIKHFSRSQPVELPDVLDYVAEANVKLYQ
jgi:hypothetical protein